MQIRPNRNSQRLSVRNSFSKTKHLYKYVWGLMGIFVLFVVSFFLAYSKVGNSERYSGEAFNSLDWEDNQKDNLTYPEP